MKRNNRFYKIVSGVVTILFIINSVAYAAPDGTWSLQKNSALRTVSTAEDAQTRESLGGALKDAQAKSINILRGLKERIRNAFPVKLGPDRTTAIAISSPSAAKISETVDQLLRRIGPQQEDILGQLRFAAAVDDKISPTAIDRLRRENPDNKFLNIGFDRKIDKQTGDVLEWYNRLGWTTEYIKWILQHPQTLADIISLAETVKGKYKYIVLCGMGGSRLCIDTVKAVFGEREPLKIFTLGTTDAAVIDDILNDIAKDAGSLEKGLRQTLIVPISKSGTTKETNSHQEYFEKIFHKFNIEPTEHMHIVTDPASAADKGQLPTSYIQLNGRTNIGGRFTAPGAIIFLLPVALMSPDIIEPILRTAVQMNEVSDINKDVFIKLGVYLYVMAKEFGKDKLTLVLSEDFKPLAPWIEQLFEESLGKDLKGITIIYGENLTPEKLQPVEESDRVFLRINVKGKIPAEQALWRYLTEKGYPTYEIDVVGKKAIGGIMLGLQRAVATIGYLWDINFTTQDAVERYKKETNAVMERAQKTGKPVEIPYRSDAKFKSITLYYQPLIEAGILSEREIADEVKAIGADVNDAAAVYAVVLRLLVGAKGFSVAELAPWSTMNPSFKSMMEQARDAIFTTTLKKASKLGIRPDGNHSFQQNVEAGRNIFFSTFLLGMDMRQPEIAVYEPQLLKAQAVGTINSIVGQKRKVVLLATDGTLMSAEKDVKEFFEQVMRYFSVVSANKTSSPSAAKLSPNVVRMKDGSSPTTNTALLTYKVDYQEGKGYVITADENAVVYNELYSHEGNGMLSVILTAEHKKQIHDTICKAAERLNDPKAKEKITSATATVALHAEYDAKGRLKITPMIDGFLYPGSSIKPSAAASSPSAAKVTGPMGYIRVKGLPYAFNVSWDISALEAETGNPQETVRQLRDIIRLLNRGTHIREINRAIDEYPVNIFTPSLVLLGTDVSERAVYVVFARVSTPKAALVPVVLIKEKIGELILAGRITDMSRTMIAEIIEKKVNEYEGQLLPVWQEALRTIPVASSPSAAKLTPAEDGVRRGIINLGELLEELDWSLNIAAAHPESNLNRAVKNRPELEAELAEILRSADQFSGELYEKLSLLCRAEDLRPIQIEQKDVAGQQFKSSHAVLNDGDILMITNQEGEKFFEICSHVYEDDRIRTVMFKPNRRFFYSGGSRLAVAQAAGVVKIEVLDINDTNKGLAEEIIRKALGITLEIKERTDALKEEVDIIINKVTGIVNTAKEVLDGAEDIGALDSLLVQTSLADMEMAYATLAADKLSEQRHVELNDGSAEKLAALHRFILVKTTFDEELGEARSRAIKAGGTSASSPSAAKVSISAAHVAAKLSELKTAQAALEALKQKGVTGRRDQLLTAEGRVGRLGRELGGMATQFVRTEEFQSMPLITDPERVKSPDIIISGVPTATGYRVVTGPLVSGWAKDLKAYKYRQIGTMPMLLEEARRKGLTASSPSAAKVTGYLFDPIHQISTRDGMDFRSPGVTRRTNEDVLKMLQKAPEPLEIICHLRGVDGPGSSLDLPEFQLKLTRQGAKALVEIPSTPTIASEFSVRIRFEPASDPNVIEYVAPDYGIARDRPYIVKGTVELVDGKTPNKQLDAPGYIFGNIFGLRGIKITLEEISPMARAGGMESSNAFNVALFAAASMLSGANWSLADIFSAAVKIENSELSGLTGGQGHLSSMLGGVYRHVWLSGIQDDKGKLINPYGAFSVPFLTEEDFPYIEDIMALVQAGTEYENGKPKAGRTAALINNMWTDLLREGDRVGLELHGKKLALTAKYTQALKRYAEAMRSQDKTAAEAAIQDVINAVNDYVDIRDSLCRRWSECVVMEGKAEWLKRMEAGDRHALAIYGAVENSLRTRLDGLLATIKSHISDLAEIRKKIKQQGEKAEQPLIDREKTLALDLKPLQESLDRLALDNLTRFIFAKSISLYSDTAKELIAAARREGIAIMPLGAGGPGANMIAISSKGREHLEKFFKAHGLSQLTDDNVRNIIQGTGTLKGYMPFKIGREPIQFKGFKEAGLLLPELPADVQYDEETAKFSAPSAAKVISASELQAKVEDAGLPWPVRYAAVESLVAGKETDTLKVLVGKTNLSPDLHDMALRGLQKISASSPSAAKVTSNELRLYDGDLSIADRARIEDTEAFFKRKFGVMPEVTTLAPGRDEVGAGHVDYPDSQFTGENPAHLFSIGSAIDLNYIAAMGRRSDNEVHIIYKDYDKEVVIPLSDLKKYQQIAEAERKAKLDPAKRQLPQWANHTLGVLMQAQQIGAKLTGMNIVLTSNIPYGAGLSNSGANCCAVAMALNKIYSLGLSTIGIVRFARDGEHDAFVGSSCGWLDQLIIMYAKKGYLVMVDYAELNNPGKLVKLFKSNLPSTMQNVLINTNIIRELADAEYADRGKELNLAFDILSKALGTEITSTSLTLTDLNMLIKTLGGEESDKFGSISLKEAGIESVISPQEKTRQQELGLNLAQLHRITDVITGNYKVPDLRRHKGLTIFQSFAVCLKRMRHQLLDSLRTPLQGEAAEKGDLMAYLAIVDAEGKSLSMQGDMEISGENGALDALLNIGYAVGQKIIDEGVENFYVAGRMKGGGDGGEVGFYVDRSKEELYKRWLTETIRRYNEWVERQPNMQGKGIEATYIEPTLSDAATIAAVSVAPATTTTAPSAAKVYEPVVPQGVTVDTQYTTLAARFLELGTMRQQNAPEEDIKANIAPIVAALDSRVQHLSTIAANKVGGQPTDEARAAAQVLSMTRDIIGIGTIATSYPQLPANVPPVVTRIFHDMSDVNVEEIKRVEAERLVAAERLGVQIEINKLPDKFDSKTDVIITSSARANDYRQKFGPDAVIVIRSNADGNDVTLYPFTRLTILGRALIAPRQGYDPNTIERILIMVYRMLTNSIPDPAQLASWLANPANFIETVILDNIEYRPEELDQIHKSTVQSWENA